MPRLCLTVEGQTEQTFAVEVLQPHLAALGVFLVNPQLTEVSRKRGRTYRGGVLKYEPIKRGILNWLKQERTNKDVFFSTMIDLYRLPKDFPGFDDASRLARPEDRVSKMEASLGDDVNDSRFIPYLQLHEFEALLLAQPQAFRSYYPNEQDAVDSLTKLVQGFSSPEAINDGEQSAPSKRIVRHIPAYGLAKPTAGPFVAKEIGLETMRAKCPHFNNWVTRLEALGSSKAR